MRKGIRNCLQICSSYSRSSLQSSSNCWQRACHYAQGGRVLNFNHSWWKDLQAYACVCSANNFYWDIMLPRSSESQDGSIFKAHVMLYLPASDPPPPPPPQLSLLRNEGSQAQGDKVALEHKWHCYGLQTTFRSCKHPTAWPRPSLPKASSNFGAELIDSLSPDPILTTATVSPADALLGRGRLTMGSWPATCKQKSQRLKQKLPSQMTM